MMLGKIDDISLYEVKYKAESILNLVSKGTDPKAIHQQEQVNKYAHLKMQRLLRSRRLERQQDGKSPSR